MKYLWALLIAPFLGAVVWAGSQVGSKPVEPIQTPENVPSVQLEFVTGDEPEPSVSPSASASASPTPRPVQPPSSPYAISTDAGGNTGGAGSAGGPGPIPTGEATP